MAELNLRGGFSVDGAADSSVDGAADSFNLISSPIGLDGNIQAPSRFLDYEGGGWAEGDLHLNTSSDLNDAGSGSDPDGSAADIGAYGGAGADT